MSEECYFFDGEDKSYGSGSFASMFETILSNGIVEGFGNMLNPSFGTNMTLLIDTGRAWIQGRYYENTASLSLSVPAADATNPRIDRVVLRLDMTNRSISAVIKAGTPATSPTVPVLQQDLTIYELSVCQYLVNAGATLPTNLVDERGYDSVVGIDTAALESAIKTGWNPINATLTYASATTMNINADLTGLIPRFAKLRWKQGGAYKYAYVRTLTATLLTIRAGTDYSVANSAITDVSWSVADPAVGFPMKFNYATGGVRSAYGTVGSATCTGTFVINGGIMEVYATVTITSNGTASGNVIIDLPITVNVRGFGVGRESAIQGTPLHCEAFGNDLLIRKYDGNYPGADGYVLCCHATVPLYAS